MEKFNDGSLYINEMALVCDYIEYMEVTGKMNESKKKITFSYKIILTLMTNYVWQLQNSGHIKCHIAFKHNNIYDGLSDCFRLFCVSAVINVNYFKYAQILN